MKKSLLCVIGGVIGGAALVSALGMKNAPDSADLGRYQLVPVEAQPGGQSINNGQGYVYRVDSVTGDVWMMSTASNRATKVAFDQ